MKSLYAAFRLPTFHGSEEEEELNRFIRGHQVIRTNIKFNGEAGEWAAIVEYLDGTKKAGVKDTTIVDYKEILNEADFKLYSYLRDVRKKLAEDRGLPVYAVLKNDQLAAIARDKPSSTPEFIKIEGIGEGKRAQFAEAFLDALRAATGATDRIPF